MATDPNPARERGGYAPRRATSVEEAPNLVTATALFLVTELGVHPAQGKIFTPGEIFSGTPNYYVRKPRHGYCALTGKALAGLLCGLDLLSSRI